MYQGYLLILEITFFILVYRISIPILNFKMANSILTQP